MINAPVRLYSNETYALKPELLSLDNAVVFDIESFPNVFTLDMECLNSNTRATWEISAFRDDRQMLMQWFTWLNQTQTPMIGFNSYHYDYPMIHFIFNNPHITVEQIYQKNCQIIDLPWEDRFEPVIWADQRFAPQIDLSKIHHFDNKAKMTSLKALQFSMRSNTVLEMETPFGTILTPEQVEYELIPYNIHDVTETKAFAQHSMAAMKYRVSLVEQFGIDVMNWNDTKIGSMMIEEKIGKELLYTTDVNGKKTKRQTPRSKLALADIIFPYIQFNHPEFQRMKDYLMQQVLVSEDIKEFGKDAKLKTKGVFTGLHATVGGLEFGFGTGGIHASSKAQKIIATDEWLIRDIDVARFYPAVAIVNKLFPEHIGEKFCEVYAELPVERKKWQLEKGSKCVEANTLKLASNGIYGNSNSIYSSFYDPKVSVTIAVNGQLLLCMLAERLAEVPTLMMIQANTDGITYYIHKDHEPQAAAVCREWETLTALELEGVDYSRMWIRDVNNYIAEDMDGSLKLKGAYWSPDAQDYYGSIAANQPPAWHKDLGNVVSIRAAVAAMVHGVDPAVFIRMTTNPYDFMCRAKVAKTANLLWGHEEIQRLSRYYVSTEGRELVKKAPPKGTIGAFKRAPKIKANEYDRVMAETGGQWDERVCTKGKTKYVTVFTKIQAGHKVQICNDVKDFDFSLVNYDWYINEARKLII